MPAILNIAVVELANTEKTSLIGTMLRSNDFGVIEDAAGAMRHVERATIYAGSEAIFNLHDTPRIEDAHDWTKRIKSYDKGQQARLTPIRILGMLVKNGQKSSQYFNKTRFGKNLLHSVIKISNFNHYNLS